MAEFIVNFGTSNAKRPLETSVLAKRQQADTKP